MGFEKWILRIAFNRREMEITVQGYTTGVDVYVLLTRRHVEGNEIFFRVMIKWLSS